MNLKQILSVKKKTVLVKRRPSTASTDKEDVFTTSSKQRNEDTTSVKRRNVSTGSTNELMISTATGGKVYTASNNERGVCMSSTPIQSRTPSSRDRIPSTRSFGGEATSTTSRDRIASTVAPRRRAISTVSSSTYSVPRCTMRSKSASAYRDIGETEYRPKRYNTFTDSYKQDTTQTLSKPLRAKQDQYLQSMVIRFDVM